MTETARDVYEKPPGRQTLKNVLRRLVALAEGPKQPDPYAGYTRVMSGDIKSPEQLTDWLNADGLEPTLEPVV